MVAMPHPRISSRRYASTRLSDCVASIRNARRRSRRLREGVCSTKVCRGFVFLGVVAQAEVKRIDIQLDARSSIADSIAKRPGVRPGPRIGVGVPIFSVHLMLLRLYIGQL